jgi:hypothetical protein
LIKTIFWWMLSISILIWKKSTFTTRGSGFKKKQVQIWIQCYQWTYISDRKIQTKVRLWTSTANSPAAPTPSVSKKVCTWTNWSLEGIYQWKSLFRYGWKLLDRSTNEWYRKILGKHGLSSKFTKESKLNKFKDKLSLYGGTAAFDLRDVIGKEFKNQIQRHKQKRERKEQN